MGSKKSVTIGYRYYMGIHMGLGRGPVDELVEIEVGGKKAWQGSVTGNQSVTIAKPNLFGGDKKEGGINGTLQVLMGGPTQTAPSGLASMLGGDVPGFRGFVSLFFDGQVSAMNPYIKPWKFRVRRSTAGWDGEAWYPTKAKIELSAGAIHAMNPAHIVYECLTNRDWGGGMDRSRLDDASFRAAADALYAEGFGLCLRWNRGDAVSDFVHEVLDHIGGNLYLSRFDGLFHLTLIRDDYDAASLPLFDEDSGLLGVDEDDNSASAGALNEIVVKWHDPISNESRSWRERNLGAVRADGQVLSESKSYAGLPTAELAGRVAVRELRAASAGLKRFKVRLDRRGYRIEPGQPFRIRSLKRGIESMVVRAGRIEDGRLDDATITITAVQDVFGLPASSMTAVQPSGWTPPDATPQAIGVRRLLERTWRDIAQDTDPANLELIDPTACYLQALAVKPTALSQGYAMQVRVGSSEWTEADDGGDFCPSGLLVAALGPADTAFTLTSGSDLDFVTPGGAALIGDEIVRVDSFDHTTLSGALGRGCVDTVPASHPAGTRLWFVEASGALEPAAYSPGTTVQARLLTQTSQGQLDPALAATDSLTLQGRQGRPYPPGNLLINGEAYPTEVSGDVVLTWAHRDRLLQADQLVDATQGDIGPETGTTYTVRCYIDGELDSESSGITTASYAWLPTMPAGTGRVEISSIREGMASWQTLAHEFSLGADLWTPEALVVQPSIWLSDESSLTEFNGRAALVANRGTLGDGADYSQAIQDRMPTLVTGTGGRRALRFNGSTQFLQAAQTGARNAYRNVGSAWALVVMRKLSVDGSPINRNVISNPPGNAGGGGRFSLGVGAVTANKLYLYTERPDSAPGVLIESSITLDASSAHVVLVIADWANNDGYIYVDGVLDSSSAAFGTAGRTSDTPAYWPAGIGAFVGASPVVHCDMECSAVLQCGGYAPSLAEIDHLMGWAAWRYGIVGNLPSSHPYKESPPTI